MLLAQSTARHCSASSRTPKYYNEQNKSPDSRGIFREQKRRIATAVAAHYYFFIIDVVFVVGFYRPDYGRRTISMDTYSHCHPLYYRSTTIIDPQKNIILTYCYLSKRLCHLRYQIYNMYPRWGRSNARIGSIN